MSAILSLSYYRRQILMSYTKNNKNKCRDKNSKEKFEFLEKIADEELNDYE